jgi:YafQ family addiction module toxin component
MYNIEINPSCLRDIEKLCRKNRVLKKVLEKKMNEIVHNPGRYKPLKYDLAGEKRVHIMKNFVLRFEVNETLKIVRFLFFGHHDEAYRR